MANSTPFRAAFFRLIGAVPRFEITSIEVGTRQGFGVDNAFHRAYVFHHSFGDGGQVVGFQLDDQVVVAEQNGGVCNMRKRANALVDALFGPGLNVDEDVSNGHGGH